MTSDDVSEVVDLFNEILSTLKYYNELAVKTEQAKYTVSKLEEKIKEDPLSVILIKENLLIVGFCFNRFDDYTVWLEWFGVKSDYRRKGIANALLNELDKSALERQCHKVWCDCRTNNLISKKVLTSNGYLPIATVNNHWYGQDFILWNKLIK